MNTVITITINDSLISGRHQLHIKMVRGGATVAEQTSVLGAALLARVIAGWVQDHKAKINMWKSGLDALR